MKVIFPILFFLLIPFSAYPQSNDSKVIKSIRDQYNQAKAKIKTLESSVEAGNQSLFAVNELVVNKHNKSWPAVGNYSVVYRFYYKQTGETHYPDHLVFVSKRTVSAARVGIEEFLFSDDGDPVFALNKNEEDKEYRLYLENRKLIKFKGSSDKSFQTALTSGAILKADEYQQLFRLSIE